MTLAEVFALLAFIVSLLVLLVQVVHVTLTLHGFRTISLITTKEMTAHSFQRWRSFLL